MFNNGLYGQQQQPQYGSQYGAGGIAPQQTGYQQSGQFGQLASQPTGYQSSFQQFQQPGASFQQQQPQQQAFQKQQPLYSQPTGFVQPLQTGFVGGNQFNQQTQQTQAPLTAQPTGFFSAAQKIEKNTELKIPNIRLSFISSQDQSKYEELFRSAVVKGSNSLSADAARDILIKSNLQPVQLARIWELSDLNKSGQLLFPEFALALHLVNIGLTGKPIPQVLEPSIKGEVTGFVDAINFSIPDEDDNKPKTPFDNLTSTPQNTLNQLGGLQFQQPVPTSFGQPLQPQSTGYQPLQPNITGYQQASGYQPLQPQSTGFLPLQPQRTGFGLQGQATGGLQSQANGDFQSMPVNTFNNFQPPQLMPQSTGYQGLVSQPTGGAGPQLLQAQKTGVGNNTFFQSNLLAPQKTGGFQNINQFQNLNNQQDFIKPQEKQLFSKIFETYDSKRQGKLDGKVCSEIFRKSGLNRSELEKVWNLVTPNNESALSKESFSLGMWLIYRKLNGHELPNRLPQSLLPDSTKIIDGVKNQLKAQPSNAFGSNFKNNDNDINYSKRNEKETTDLDLLKAQLEHKQYLLDSLNKENATLSSLAPPSSNSNDLKAIEDLKNQIKAIPFGKNTEKLQLKDKLTSLTSRVPELINEISRINNEITNSQIELFKIHHPSSIFGTGPNGEVTEADKRKAKNKALLNQRMAALTGKPVADVVDLDSEQREFEAEVSKIRQSNKENQEIILDIEKTIKDLAKGAETSLGSSINQNYYKKFELGIGVDAEVADLVKQLRISNTSITAESFKPQLVSARSTPEVPQKSQAVQDISNSSTPDSFSSHKTPEDRAAYIKEQAKKRMNERLAKFGLSRGKSESNVPVSKSISPPPAQEVKAPGPVVAKPVPQEFTPPVAEAQPPVVQSQPVSQAPVVIKAPELVISSLQNKKKQEKEERLAELRRQLEEAEKEEDSEDEVEVVEPKAQTYAPQVAKLSAPPPPPTRHSQQFAQQSPTSVPVQEPVAITPVPNAPIPVPQQKVETVHHGSNPFAKNMAVSSNNPFGKPQVARPTISAPVPNSIAPITDLKQIEAQRNAQRGLENQDDDGWSDDDNAHDEDEDDIPNRQGAAHLAGLLFSGMGPVRTNSNSQISTPKEEKPQPKFEVKEKAVPIATPIPSIAAPISNQSFEQPQAQESIPSPPALSQPPVPIATPLPIIETPSISTTPALPTVEPDVPPALQEDNDEEFFTPEPEPQFVPPPPPPLPEASAPPAPPLPEFSVPAAPALPEFAAPPAPPLPEFSAPAAPALPEFAAPAPPLPEFSAPAAPALPEFAAPAPPLPEFSAPAALALPEFAAPPPPLPQFSAPPAPPVAPPPPSLPATSAPAAPAIGGGLPFLAEIQRRRDDSHTVG